jgi:hypothetical protein
MTHYHLVEDVWSNRARTISFEGEKKEMPLINVKVIEGVFDENYGVRRPGAAL